MAWTNNDGLLIKFGAEEATVATVGEMKTYGAERMDRLTLDLTVLGTAAARVGSETFTLPAGARITKIKVINQTAAVGTNATLNLGLQRLDRTTELDYDGLLVAAPRTDWDAAGETKEYAVGVTGVGALVGTSLAYPGYLTADYDTAAFTQGVVQIEIYWYKP